MIGRRRRVLTIKRLRCIETEDLVGRDEARLEVWADGQFDGALRMRLKNGQHKNLGAVHEFNDSVRVLLFDEDVSEPSDILRHDADDTLGSHGFAALGSQTRHFTRDGAHYELSIEVTEGAPGPATDADDLLDAFAASDALGRWPMLDKATIIEQARERLASPWLVQQGPTNTCGPAAVLFELIRRSPRHYVRLLQSLYERGRFRLKDGSSITSSAALRQAPARSVTEDGDTRSVPDADWLVLAPLRESANVVFSGPEKFDDLGSTHWEVAGWLWKLCGYNRVGYFPGVLTVTGNVLTTFDTPARKWLDEARRVLAKDGAAIASIDTGMLGKEIIPFFSTPKHLVSLVDSRHSLPARCGERVGDLGPLRITSKGFVEWSLFTWGRIQRETTSARDFESGMWVLITGY